ncbi:50S ribosomal protein L32 [Candidatus Berkelbacteria bacterium CG08_land_8_20_14_0_20_39_8]|uniref:Large ribosomal subunit protein bL32 n=1 Tax=Candidatus Berkelbacteria bacterium CG08_land_8_20_14_0_20_39_8 TaxID=1974511 RepID=A0A2M6YD39_9BACT|nr:MAG: 50S ribosomal protein L32 [Candidatus Berkelbacteria bacterium CG08_land_8_20_14_0_20_39_8]
MAEPKKKLSKSRTRSRRHQIKMNEVHIDFCNQCHEAKLRHNVCQNCGTYRGKKVIEQKGKADAIEDQTE